MQLPPWLEDVRDRYERFWSAPEARADSQQRQRRAPAWLLAVLPFVLIVAAIAVLLIAIAVKH